MNFIYLFITIFSLSIAQLSVHTLPPSIIESVNNNVPVFITPDFNLDEILKQDNLDLKEGYPYKFGHNFNVDINFFDYAIVDTLSNGDKIFRFKIYSPDAYSINLIFNSFYLPKGTQLFIYDNDYSNQIGAFTYINNKSYNRFSTSPVSGEQIILEYFEPFAISELPQINIEGIIHGYQPTFSNSYRGYDDSQSCNNNVNCPEAQPWIDEKNSVVMTLTDGGTRLCSGAMINNVNQDFELYFLTSQTCLGGHEDWIFMFNYESPTCNNQNGTTDNTLSGATLLSHNGQSDFALLKLDETPPENYNVYFSGWDARQIIPSNCVSIHHPVGDIKKISFHQGNAISDGWFSNDGSHWRIEEWSSGITEPGSYGGPLFNENFHLIGQLHGGESSCADKVNDYYGKFSRAWNLGLKEWLDPDNTETLVLDGIAVNDIPDPQLSYNLTEDNIYVLEKGKVIANGKHEELVKNSEVYKNFYEKQLRKD